MRKWTQIRFFNPQLLYIEANTTYQLLTDHLFPELSLLLSFSEANAPCSNTD